MSKINIALLYTILFLLSSVVYAQNAEDKYELKLRTGSLEMIENTFDRETYEVGDREIYEGRFFRLIQFSTIPTNEEKERLEAKGITLLSYLPHYTYFASVKPSVQWNEELTNESVRSIVPIDSRVKLHPNLYRKEYPEWAVFGGRNSC